MEKFKQKGSEDLLQKVKLFMEKLINRVQRICYGGGLNS